jgi:putative PEP-CTERM system histidine kinase
MPFASIGSFIAAGLSAIMATAILVHDRHSPVHRLFAAGILLFAVEEAFRGLIPAAILGQNVVYWQEWIFAVAALSTAVWLGFSISYARIDVDSFFSKWKTVLFGVGAAPVLFVAIFRTSLFRGSAVLLENATRWSIPLSWAGQLLQIFFIGTSVLVLFNLERTTLSSIGRIRWQIKFTVLGVGVLFALRIYLASQSLLYNNLDTGFGTINTLALIAANLLFGLSLYRTRSLNVDVYLSSATIQNSFTVILAGIYLLAVGILAQLARHSASNRSLPPLPIDAFIVFLSLTGLAVFLLSNRLRWKLRIFVSQHFRRPIYDYRSIWMELTSRTTSLMDANALSTAAARMVSESLEILSVSIWLVDESERRLTLGGSTALSGPRVREIEKAGKSAADFVRFLRQQSGCLDLDMVDCLWQKEIMEAGQEFFREDKMRYAIGLQAGGELVGVMTLNDDRVGGENKLSVEDLALLETLAAQLAASLLNLKLSARLRHNQEIETFQMVSTFFVHDLKNVASRLSLTMQNLPANFDNVEFRKDALRVISTSLAKIDDLCSRVSMLKPNIDPKVAQCDLNSLVASALEEFKANLRAKLEHDFQPLPKALIDAEQINTVLTNLVMNANEAVNGNGVIRVATVCDGISVGFVVRDNGCGMTKDFIEKSLFRPFQTTKKRGLGIGLFQSKLIVEAHRGTFEVTSAVGAGTEFRVMLPALFS